MYTEKIVLSLTKDQKANIKKYAKIYGLTVTALIRSSINTFLYETEHLNKIQKLIKKENK